MLFYAKGLFAVAHIKQLDQNTINKIAAGEVIERPCAVVKELVENAIDARSTAITIEIKDGGISFIRITENGCGINDNEIETAFLRHATSKISSIEDLLSVSSLGFRGEALSSIASVAQVELITKETNELMGTRYVIEGGKEMAKESIGCPEGTTFIVRNLFYNTPVRRKFLKTPTTETSHINDYVEKLAISHPSIAFKFISNGQIKLNTSGNGKQKDIIYNVYGRDITSNIIEVDNHSIDISVTGYVGKAIISRGNRNLENYFINGRYIKSSLINKAIEEAYKSYMMVHKYPFTLLNINVDSNSIDVNVHPTKMEIRFMEGAKVYDFIYHTVKSALDNVNMIPQVTVGNDNIEKNSSLGKRINSEFNNELGNNDIKRKSIRADKEHSSKESNTSNNRITTNNSFIDRRNMKIKSGAPEPFEINRIKENVNRIAQLSAKINENQVNDESGNLYRVDTSKIKITKDDLLTNVVAEQVSLFNKDEEHHIEKKNDIRIVGQVFNTYWIIEFEGKMFIIDQHAAHEKVMYERIMKDLETKDIISQNIAPPMIVTLNMNEEDYLKEHMEVFKELGFEIEHFGGKEYSISAIPANLPGKVNKEFFLDVLDNLMSGSVTKSDILIEKIASMSCKAAVKGNNNMSYLEMEKLIEELFTLDNPYNCPHGRPTTIAITKSEMEKKFKRQV